MSDQSTDRPKLSEFEQSTLDALRASGEVFKARVSVQTARALNRLVGKGYAVQVGSYPTRWQPFDPERRMATKAPVIRQLA